jgi:hypothetical protein
MYRGNLPSADEGWRKVGECLDDDEVLWGVFARGQNHSSDWLTFKISADGRAHTKANYWLVKNINTGQLGFARDFAIMRTNRPSLHWQVESIINNLMVYE